MRAIAPFLLLSFFAITAFSLGGEDSRSTKPASPTASDSATEVLVDLVPPEAPANFRVAFIGDQGLRGTSLAVLQLIKEEGAQMVIHSGDFDYKNDPRHWDEQITQVLGPSFPYFASVGNHDVKKWPGYREKLLQRLSQVEGAGCWGDYGVNAACTYKGIFFILSGAGTLGSGHTDFIRTSLVQDSSIWRICSWHKNQRATQVGGKSDEVGWRPYEACLAGGAMVVNAHEHSYSRTRTLTSIEKQIVSPGAPGSDELRVGPGSTFVVVSGLGGESIRGQQRCLPRKEPYGCKGEWARIYTSDQDADYGALFIDFNAGGDPARARGYFKNIRGEVVDSFTIVAATGR